MMEHFLRAIMQQLEHPRADLEKNVKALLSEMITRLDIASQEELLRQEHLLLEAQKSIQMLNQQVDALSKQIESLN